MDHPTTTMCPRYQAAVELLGKRWTGLVLRVLMDGPRRFSEIAGALPDVSDRMVSERLKELEAEGVLERRVLNSRPIGVEYTLTEKGHALSGVIEEIGRWAEKWIDPKPARSEAKPARAAGGRR